MLAPTLVCIVPLPGHLNRCRTLTCLFHVHIETTEQQSEIVYLFNKVTPGTDLRQSLFSIFLILESGLNTIWCCWSKRSVTSVFTVGSPSGTAAVVSWKGSCRALTQETTPLWTVAVPELSPVATCHTGISFYFSVVGSFFLSDTTSAGFEAG